MTTCWPDWNGGNSLRTRTDGCALCGSTWGDYYEDVEGERRFFCCELCAKQLRVLCQAIRTAEHWPEIDALELEGGRYGRRATAHRGSLKVQYEARFDLAGELSHFAPTSGPASPK